AGTAAEQVRREVATRVYREEGTDTARTGVQDRVPAQSPEPPGHYRGNRFDAWCLRVAAVIIDGMGVAPGGTLWSLGGQWYWPGGPTIGIVVTVPLLLYNRCWLHSRTGQSIGKRAARLKLIVGSGAHIGFSPLMAGLREVLNYLTIFVLGFLFPLWTA